MFFFLISLQNIRILRVLIRSASSPVYGGLSRLELSIRIERNFFVEKFTDGRFDKLLLLKAVKIQVNYNFDTQL